MPTYQHEVPLHMIRQRPHLALDILRDVGGVEEILRLDEYQWQSDFAIEHRSAGRAEGRAEGEALGAAKVLLLILRARNVCVSPEAEERITGCSDLEQLEHWAERAVIVDKVDELFD